MEGDYCTQFGTEEVTITRTAGDWRMIQCAALGAIDELDRKMDEIDADQRLSTVQRADRIDSCLSARASLDRLVSAIAETKPLTLGPCWSVGVSMATTHTPGLSLSLTQAASLVAENTGHRPNPATLYRMAMSGRLEHRRFGRRILTSREAVLALIESFNAPKPAPTARPEPRADVQQAGAEAAERIARSEG